MGKVKGGTLFLREFGEGRFAQGCDLGFRLFSLGAGLVVRLMGLPPVGKLAGERLAGVVDDGVLLLLGHAGAEAAQERRQFVDLKRGAVGLARRVADMRGRVPAAHVVDIDQEAGDLAAFFLAVIFKLCRDLTKRLERREGYSNVRYCVLPDFHKARGYVRIALFECGSSGTTEASQYECASFGYIDRLTGNSMSNIGREVRGNVNDPRLVECFTHYGFVPSPVITASLTPAT